MTLLKQTTDSRADDSLTNSGKDDDLQTDCCSTLSLISSGSLEKDLRTLTLSGSKSVKSDQGCESGIESLSASCSIHSHSAWADRSDVLKQGSVTLTQNLSASLTDHRCSRNEASLLADDADKPSSHRHQSRTPPLRGTGTQHVCHDAKKKDKALRKRLGSGCWNEMCQSFPDKDGDTLLHLAVLQAVTHLAHLVRLLGLGGQVNRRNRLYQTPLHLAVLTSNTRALDLLRGLPGASLHLQDCRGNTALHAACLQNDPDSLRLLLLEDEAEEEEDDGGGDCDGGGRGRRRSRGKTELQEEELAATSDSDHFQLNQRSSGKVSSSQDDFQSKSSMQSSGYGSESLLLSDRTASDSLLTLKEKTDKGVGSIRGGGGATDCLQRREENNTTMVGDDNDADDDCDDDDDDDDDGGKTVCGGDDGQVNEEEEEEEEEEEDWEGRVRRQRREAKVALCLKNYDGLTCLHLAVLQDNAKLVALLLRHGADVNARDGKSGRTALHLAVDSPSPSSPVLSTLLLHPDLHINATNFAQQTALQLARGRHHHDLVDLLHIRGARWSDSIHGGSSYSSSSDGFSDEDVEDDLFVPYDDLCVAGRLLTA